MINFKCTICSKEFKRSLAQYRYNVKTFPDRKYFCSTRCSHLYKGSSKTVTCKQCMKTFTKNASHIKRTKNNFCCKSCAATYNNTHKTTGNRRSKLELWVEKKLISQYSHLTILYNKKNAINSELDIYVPELKLAFELNGIYHYEPIHGKKLLKQIKNNDSRKFQACLEKNIELCIIDTSRMTYFKESNATPYLKIITDIIDSKITRGGGN